MQRQLHGPRKRQTPNCCAVWWVTQLGELHRGPGDELGVRNVSIAPVAVRKRCTIREYPWVIGRSGPEAPLGARNDARRTCSVDPPLFGAIQPVLWPRHTAPHGLTRAALANPATHKQRT